MRVEWDLTPEWWGQDWWRQHIRPSKFFPKRTGTRDANSVGYMIEIILQDVPYDPEITCTNTRLIVAFEIESEERYLATVNDRLATLKQESDLDADPIGSIEEHRKRVADRIDFVVNPCPTYGVKVSVPSPRLQVFGSHGWLDLHVSGLQPFDRKFSVSSPCCENDYEALKAAFVSALGVLDSIKPTKGETS